MKKDKQIQFGRLMLAGVFSIAFIAWLIVKISIAYKANENALNEHLPSTYNISKEELDLICKRYRDSVEVIEVKNSKVRPCISILILNNKYHLMIYKIYLKSELASIDSLFSITNSDEDISSGYSYATIKRDIIYQMKYKSGMPKEINKIYLTLKGDFLLKGVKNDSILSYHLQCKNASLRYEKDGPIDMLFIGEEKLLGRISKFPMDILFLKRDSNSIYLMVMTPKDIEGSIAPDLLYNVVTGK